MEIGNDSTFQDIIQIDSLGRDYLAQRDAWREGTSFPFLMEFFAREQEVEEDPGIAPGGSALEDASVLGDGANKIHIADAIEAEVV